MGTSKCHCDYNQLKQMLAVNREGIASEYSLNINASFG